MTEQELIAKHQQSDNVATYLMKVGMFFHAYEAGPFALARATGYRIKRKLRKGGREVLVAGFPAESLDAVIAKLKTAGATIIRHSDTFVEMTGIDGTSNETLADSINPDGNYYRKENERTELRKLKELIHSFDLVSSTPIEALNFVDRLQKTLFFENKQ